MKRVIISSATDLGINLEQLMRYHTNSLVDKLTAYSRDHAQLKSGGFPRGSSFFVKSKNAGRNSYSFELYYQNPLSYDDPRTRFVDSFVMTEDVFTDNDAENKQIIDEKIDKYIAEYYHKYD